uniref:Putative secreted protein n=1 Tax=Ixodes ricinus TaxID=34613 RepID=A0A6B0UC50_IXORI
MPKTMTIFSLCLSVRLVHCIRMDSLQKFLLKVSKVKFQFSCVSKKRKCRALDCVSEHDTNRLFKSRLYHSFHFSAYFKVRGYLPIKCPCILA